MYQNKLHAKELLDKVFPETTEKKITKKKREIKNSKVIAKNAIKDSAEKFRSLLQTSPDALLLLDLNGNVVMCNKQVMETFGYENVDEIYERNILDHFDEDEQRLVEETLFTVLSEGSVKNKEILLKKETGEHIPVEASFSLVLDSNGEPKAISSVFRDISERKKAEEDIRKSELRFRSVWESSNDGMRLTDADGIMIAVNSSFCEMVGMGKEDLLGKPFYDIYHFRQREEALESLKKYKDKLAKNDFKSVKHYSTSFRSEKKVDVDVTYTLINYEKSNPMLLSIFRDVSERIRAEQELRESEKLAAIGKMAAYLSHEIKTPLASIKANIEMLSKDLTLTAKKERSFNIVQREVKRLDKLLKDVLQFSKDQELVIANIKLVDLFNYIYEFISPTLEQKGIRWVQNIGDAIILGDYQKLHSVFLHLIENSIDAIESEGIIEISAEVDNKDHSVSVFIKDTGSGIKNHDKIFNPFFTEKPAGTGLGLAIAQKIIEQHKGEIKLISSIPGETVFKVIFNRK
jgi:PAS domain S-box-containing protein